MSTEFLPNQQQIIAQHTDLVENLGELVAFINGDIFPSVDPAEQSRMKRQASAMRGLRNILKERIDAFSVQA